MMRLPLAVALLLGLLLTTPAIAQPDDDGDPSLQEAIRQSELGRLFFDGGDFAEAAEAFTRAWELHPDPVLGYNAARSYENSGSPDRAIDFYRLTLELEGTDADLAGRCRDAITRIENLLSAVEPTELPPQLVVESSPSGATVFIDEVESGVTPLEVEQTPGDYDVRVSLAGYFDHEQVVALNVNQVVTLQLALDPIPPPPERQPNWLWVGVTAGSAGLFAAVAAIAAASANDAFDEAQQAEVQRNDSLWQQTVDDGRALQASSNFLYGLSIAAGITSVVLYFVTDTSDDVEERTGVRFDLNPSGLGVVW